MFRFSLTIKEDSGKESIMAYPPFNHRYPLFSNLNSWGLEVCSFPFPPRPPYSPKNKQYSIILTLKLTYLYGSHCIITMLIHYYYKVLTLLYSYYYYHYYKVRI